MTSLFDTKVEEFITQAQPTELFEAKTPDAVFGPKTNPNIKYSEAESLKRNLPITDRTYQPGKVITFYELDKVRRMIQRAGWPDFVETENVASIFDGASPSNWTEEYKRTTRSEKWTGSTQDKTKLSRITFRVNTPLTNVDPRTAFKCIVKNLILTGDPKNTSISITDVARLDRIKYFEFYRVLWNDFSGGEGFASFKQKWYLISINENQKSPDLPKLQSEANAFKALVDSGRIPTANELIPYVPPYEIFEDAATTYLISAMAALDVGGVKLGSYMTYIDANLAPTANRKFVPGHQSFFAGARAFGAKAGIYGGYDNKSSFV